MRTPTISSSVDSEWPLLCSSPKTSVCAHLGPAPRSSYAGAFRLVLRGLHNQLRPGTESAGTGTAGTEWETPAQGRTVGRQEETPGVIEEVETGGPESVVRSDGGGAYVGVAGHESTAGS